MTTIASRSPSAGRFLSGGIDQVMGEALTVLWLIWAFRANELAPVLTPPITLGLSVLGFFAVLITRPRGSTTSTRISIAVMLWIGLWIMSSLWAWNFWVWFADARVSIGLIGVGMLIGGVVEIDRIARGLCTAVYLIIAMTIVFSVTGGVDEGGAWIGAFSHKNLMGGFMALAILILMQLEQRIPFRMGGIAAAMGLVLLSQSATALLMVAAAGATVVILRRAASLPRREAAAYFFSVFTLVLFSLVFLGIQYVTVVSGLGRDGSLSGRTELWPSVWHEIQQSPIIGWGPGLWIQQNADPARYVGAQTGFNVGHSHNTFLEVLLLWGVIGLVLYLGMVVALFRSAWRLVRADPRWSTLALGFIAVLLVQSISEPALIGWVGMIAMLHVLMQRLWDDHRRSAVTSAVDDLDIDRLVR